MDLSLYSQALLRYWPLLLIGAVLGAAVGYVNAARRPTLYEASATVLVAQGAPQAVATSRALLENNTLAAETIAATGLDQPPFSLTPQQFVPALRVDQVSGTSLMKVKVVLPDPAKAAEAVTVLAGKAVELNRRIASAEGVAVQNLLAEHLKEAADRLGAAEQKLFEYQDKAQVEVLRKDTEAMLDERGDLLKLLMDIEAEKSRLAAAEREIQNQEPFLPYPRAVGVEEALRRSAAIRPDGRAARSSDDPALDLTNPFINPVYHTLAFQIASRRTRLAGLERDKDERVAIRKLDADRFAKLTDLYRRELDLARLEAEHEIAAEVYADLAIHFEKSRTESLSRMALLQVVDSALPPAAPLSKRRDSSMALGLAAGLMLAALVAVILGSRQRTV